MKNNWYTTIYISGEIAPVGPTSFEFVIPEGAPVTISPSVGTVMPGKVNRNFKDYLLYVLVMSMVVYNVEFTLTEMSSAGEIQPNHQ